MDKIKSLKIVVGFLSIVTGCEQKNTKETPALNMEKFKVGQVWKYATRDGEHGSTLTILKVDEDASNGKIIHIRLDGIKIYNAKSSTGYNNMIPHLPFSETALAKSITTFATQQDSIPQFSEGYNEWKKSYDEGKGGVWTIEVKDAISSIDNVMRSIK
jgi:hypothetical protein